MSVAGWLRGLFGARAQGTLAPVDSAAIRRGEGLWEAFAGGAEDGPPSEQQALAVSAVHACVSLIAGAIAALPMTIYRRSADGDLTRDPAAALWWMLNEEFAPRWPASAGWSFVAASKLLHGDGFAEILRGPGGRVTGLLPVHPNRVRVIASRDGLRLVYEVQPDPTVILPDADIAGVRVIDQDDMLHVPGFGFNGLRGLSPLRHALRVSGRLAIRAQDFSSSFLGNMARPDFVLKTGGNLTDEQFRRLQERFDDHRGTLRGGKPMVLEGGLSVEPLTMPIEDMQLIETRRFQVEEIARIYGVPPFMIGHTEKTTSWGSGVDAMGIGFVRFTLREHLNAFQNEINRKFWPRRATHVAEFDTAELERADTKSLFEALRIGLGRAGEPAFLTLEEARRVLRLPQRMEGTVPQQQAAPPQPDRAPAPAPAPEPDAAPAGGDDDDTQDGEP